MAPSVVRTADGPVDLRGTAALPVGERRPLLGGQPRTVRLLALAAAAVLLVGLLVVLRATLVGPVLVSSSSMLPTLGPGDVVLVTPVHVDLEGLRHGDLVTFRSPQDGERALKRVVGLPGDTVVIKDAVLYVNEQPVPEPYVDHELIDAYYSRTYTVPPGTLFVMGDHRSNSLDSRDYGPVPEDALQGRVLRRLWPLRRA